MGGAKKQRSLSGALAAQQARLTKKAQAAHAAHVQATQGKAAKGKGKARAPAPVVPFAPTDSILLLGEGDFSFARALVCAPPPSLAALPPAHVTATAYDSEEECYAKYPGARAHVDAVRARGARVLFGVDATQLGRCAALKSAAFDRVVWNFPHAGKGIADQDRNVHANQTLLLDFLRAAPAVLARGAVPDIMPKRKRDVKDDDEEEAEAEAAGAEAADEEEPQALRGTVLITLRNVPPYTLWDLPRLAKSPPPPASRAHAPSPRYTLLRSFAFRRALWAGYAHAMTKGARAGGTGTTGAGGEDRTWEFCLADSPP